MTQVFIYRTASEPISFPDPGNWNPNDNTVECVSNGGNGATTNSMTMITAGGGGGGGGAYAIGRNLDPPFPVEIGFSFPGANSYSTIFNGNFFFNWLTLPPNCVAAFMAFNGSYGIGGSGGGGPQLRVHPEGFVGGSGGSSLADSWGGGAGGGAAGPNGPGQAGQTKPGALQLAVGGSGDGGVSPGGAASGQAGTSGMQWDHIHGVGGGGASTVIQSVPGGPGGWFGGGGSGAYGQTGFRVVGQGGPALIVVTWHPPIPPRLATFMA